MGGRDVGGELTRDAQRFFDSEVRATSCVVLAGLRL